MLSEQEILHATQQNNSTPTLLIGLGGTGAKAIQAFRQKMMERSGRIRKKGLKFLVIDTDRHSQKPAHDVTSGDVRLRFDFPEYIPISERSVVELVNFGIHHVSWFDKSLVSNVASDLALPHGSGQFRAVGRLAYAYHQDKIQRHIVHLRQEAIAELEQEETAVVKVYIVTGVPGGTGSGILFDLCADIRKCINRDHKIVLLLACASNFDERSSRSKANAHAFYTELNHYNSHPYTRKNQGETESIDAGRLFDMCFFYGVKSWSGHSNGYFSPKVFVDIGAYLFELISDDAMAHVMQVIHINRAMYLHSSVALEDDDGNVDTWRSRFSSFGMFEYQSTACVYDDPNLFRHDGSQVGLEKLVLSWLEKALPMVQKPPMYRQWAEEVNNSICKDVYVALPVIPGKERQRNMLKHAFDTIQGQHSLDGFGMQMNFVPSTHPSTITIVTELHAFPLFYLSEIYGADGTLASYTHLSQGVLPQSLHIERSVEYDKLVPEP